MWLKRAKDTATILQGIAAAVFLYTWLFPSTANPSGDPVVVTHWTPAQWSALALGISVLLGTTLNLISQRKKPAKIEEAIESDNKIKDTEARPPSSPKLKIHSAFYGTGPSDERDVSEQLRNHGADGLVISVDNNTLRCDPSPNRPKRLRVTYSYLNDAIWEIVRSEHSRLILPEDRQFIERTAAEYENKRKADLDKQAAEYEKQLKAFREKSEAECVTEYERGRKDEQNAAEARREYARQLTAPKPEPQMTTLQFQRYHRIKGEFDSLRWSQKIALKQVCQSPSSEFDLQMYLANSRDFGGPIVEKIIQPLLDSNLVEKNRQGVIEAKADKLDLIDKFLNERPLC